MARLTIKKVVKLIRRKEKGLSSALIARQLGISKRRVNQVWRIQTKTRCFKLNKVGRKPTRFLSDREEKLIFSLHIHQQTGARVIAKLLRKRHKIKIGNNLVHDTLLKNNMAVPNIKKQQRRKPWIRYEREHSLSAGHMDWHTSKWKEGLQVGTVIDDSSRKILSAVECEHATEEETIQLVKNVLGEYGHIRRIREIITDHGTQFFCNTPDKEGIRGMNKFQEFLLQEGIKPILCKYKHPQSNGKQEKWFDTYEKHRNNFSSLQEFVKWYNETRVHESIDLRTPEKVFWERLESFVWEATGSFLRRF